MLRPAGICLASTTQDLAGLDRLVRFDYLYDCLGRVASVAAVLDDGQNETADYVNHYTYDNLGRATRITQSGVSGGNAVAPKRVDLVYDRLGQRDSLTRFAQRVAR